MDSPLWAAPVGQGNVNTVMVTSREVHELILVAQRLVGLTKQSRGIDYGRYYREAMTVFANVRALRGVAELLAEQPGYGRDPAGEARRAAMRPLRAKVEELCKAIEQKCNPVNPLPVLAPGAVRKKLEYANELVNIVVDPRNAGLIDALRDDKSVPASYKQEFLQALGWVIQDALTETLHTGKEEEVLRKVEEAIEGRARDTMMGACVTALSLAASSVGNLPGPDSYYVSLVKLMSLDKLWRVMTQTQSFSEAHRRISRHLTKALRLTPGEEGALRQHVNDNILYTRLNEAEKAAAARIQAGKVIEGKCAEMQTSAVYNWSITILNVILLLGALDDLRDFDKKTDDEKLNTGLSVAGSVLGTAAGAAASARGSFEVARRALSSSLIDVAGKAVSYVAAAAAIVSGVTAVVDGEKEGDGWKMFVGGAQVVSGAFLLVGLISCSFRALVVSPLGVVVGGVFLAIQLADAVLEMSKDPLEGVVKELLKQLREAKTSWDGSAIIDLLEIRSPVEQIEALSGGVGVLLVDPLSQSPRLRQRVVERVERLGFRRAHAERLVVHGGVLESMRDFSARGLGSF